MDNHPKEQKLSKFVRYMSLNAPKSRILDEVLQIELIPLPRKFQSPPNADMSKYCQYHYNNGHTTDECETLRDKIPELIRVDHLKHYVKHAGEGGSRPNFYRSLSGRIDRRGA